MRKHTESLTVNEAKDELRGIEDELMTLSVAVEHDGGDHSDEFAIVATRLSCRVRDVREGLAVDVGDDDAPESGKVVSSSPTSDRLTAAQRLRDYADMFREDLDALHKAFMVLSNGILSTGRTDAEEDAAAKELRGHISTLSDTIAFMRSAADDVEGEEQRDRKVVAARAA